MEKVHQNTEVLLIWYLVLILSCTLFENDKEKCKQNFIVLCLFSISDHSDSFWFLALIEPDTPISAINNFLATVRPIFATFNLAKFKFKSL